jgi:hypothetical protein
MYKLLIDQVTKQPVNLVQRLSDKAYIPFDPGNIDYQEFKKSVLDQQANVVIEDEDSFSLNDNPDASILEDSDGNVMTMDEAKEYVRTLP